MTTGQIVASAVLALVVWSTTAFGAGGEPKSAPTARTDPHSLGNPDRIRVTRVELELAADFGRKQLSGAATLTVERQPGCPPGTPLDLDTRGLSIESVSAGASDDVLTPATFQLGPEAPVAGETPAAPTHLGTRLRIALPDDARRVRVAYHTGPAASALQWLEPAMTAGGKTPFLFTQSESIHARSWIPLQDSPGVRVTYAATIRVPAGLRAVMSADHRPGDEAKGLYRFDMPQAVPPYLIALAVGDLAFRPLGPRTGVYAEPSVVEAAAREFVDTEAMIAAIEKRYGPYRWGRYDLLVLPPSFPMGGMENPKLTFATPTVIAGDRSLVSLVAHELAHSWSGNLVSNATWSDFWLNEGFTTYIERRVTEDVFGPERAAMERVLSLRDLRREIKGLPKSEQVLHIDLAGRNPDDGVTSVPYDKGALFLETLEQAVGRARFDDFVRGYFDHFAFRSIRTADFEHYLRKHLFSNDGPQGVDIHAWLYEPGLPPGFPQPSSKRLDAAEQAALAWSEGRLAVDRLEAKGWSTQEWLHFLRSCPEKLSAAKMAELDRAFALTDVGNAEIADQWLLMAIRSDYTPASQRLEQFLTSIGRRKFLTPLYGALVKTPEGKARARAIYARARPTYHPMSVEAIDRLLEAD
jgi:aminopeptidase N